MKKEVFTYNMTKLYKFIEKELLKIKNKFNNMEQILKDYNHYNIEDVYTEALLEECKKECSKRNKQYKEEAERKVGILKDNEINVERKLNTKLDKVNYIEYDNLTDMYNDFYNQKFRAVVVTENQYKYLLNNEATGAKAVKILYEFEANAQK